MDDTPNPIRPRFGTFLTMVVGVLLVFGFLSQAQQVYEAVYVEEAPSRERPSLSEQRQRELIVIGARPPESAAASQQPLTPARGLVGGAPLHTAPAPTGSGHLPNLQHDPLPPAPAVEPSPFRAPPPPPPPGPRYYTVRQQGETLYGIAKTIYGDGNQWRAIREANPSLENPNRIFPGMRLVIPEPERMTPAFRAWLSRAEPPARQTL